MTISRKILTILLFTSIYGCIHSYTNEGIIRYKITYSGNIDTASIKLLPQNITLNFKNSILRLKMTGGISNLKPIIMIDGLKSKVTLINNFTGKAESRKLLKKDTSLVNTGITEIVSGYKCKMFKASNRNTTYSVWAATELPATIGGTSRLEGFYLSSYDGIPLKIIDKEQDFTINFTADSISLTPQLDSLFVIKSK